MPTYSYQCENCSEIFELFSYIKDYNPTPKCSKCGKNNTVRMYTLDIATQSCSVKKHDTELKTIGDLANRNRDKLSDDQKIELYNKHNSYKHDSPQTTLPKGMSRIKKPKTKKKWT